MWELPACSRYHTKKRCWVARIRILSDLHDILIAQVLLRACSWVVQKGTLRLHIIRLWKWRVLGERLLEVCHDFVRLTEALQHLCQVDDI